MCWEDSNDLGREKILGMDNVVWDEECSRMRYMLRVDESNEKGVIESLGL
jgi:hypothetical protein